MRHNEAVTHEHVPLDAAALRAALGPTVGRLEVVPRTGSTNVDLRAALAADPAAWPDLSVLVADHQDAGRGRSGRDWHTPPGTSLTASFLVRPGAVPPSSFGWLTLLGALAVVRALEGLGLRAGAKWPNDVVVDAGPRAGAIDGWGTGRKVAGVLGEVAAEGLVLGIGVNVAQEQAELPVAWAASLATLGAALGDRPREELLVALAEQLRALVERWRSAGGDAVAAGLVAEYVAVSATLGRPVAVEAPGGGVVAGVAEHIADDGGLLVRRADGELVLVRSGDVHHVRLRGV